MIRHTRGACTDKILSRRAAVTGHMRRTSDNVWTILPTRRTDWFDAPKAETMERRYQPGHTLFFFYRHRRKQRNRQQGGRLVGRLLLRFCHAVVSDGSDFHCQSPPSRPTVPTRTSPLFPPSPVVCRIFRFVSSSYHSRSVKCCTKSFLRYVKPVRLVTIHSCIMVSSRNLLVSI